MADGTGIEWTDATWNPTVGCSVISPGCTNCYAMKMAGRLEAMGSPIYRGHTIKTKAGHVWNGKVGASNHGQMIKPLSWKKPRRIFVNSMSDLFHEDMPESVIDQVFAVMALCPQHTFQVLTKRSARMRAYCTDPSLGIRIGSRLMDAARGNVGSECAVIDITHALTFGGLPNVWLGVSVEDQPRKFRIDDLRATPAAIRFLSFEPLLEDLGVLDLVGIHQAIVGGESGPRRRPVDLDWMRSIQRQCEATGTAFFGKQLDKVRPLPPDLMVREFHSS